jgi:transcriptional regulator with XRE-family HTH domain
MIVFSRQGQEKESPSMRTHGSKRVLTETMGDRIALLRKRLGLNQGDLADAVGMSKSQISRLERDESETKISYLPILAQKLHTSVQFLVTGEDIVTEEVDAFLTTEANQIGAMVDRVDPDVRQIVLIIVREITLLDEQRRNLQDEYAAVLLESIQDLNTRQRQRALSILAKMNKLGGIDTR